jgi:nucleoside-diphosphate-sugar epimerase
VANRLMRAHKSGKVWATIGRAADVYGPGVINSVAGAHLFRAVLNGKRAMWFGNLDIPHSLTFVDDFARGLVTLSEHEDAPGEIWHIPTAEPLTGRQFIQITCDEAHRTVQMDAFNRPIMTVMSIFSPHVRELLDTLYQFEAPFILDTSKYRRTFGDMPATPHREAIYQTLEWFRHHPTAEPPSLS